MLQRPHLLVRLHRQEVGQRCRSSWCGDGPRGGTSVACPGGIDGPAAGGPAGGCAGGPVGGPTDGSPGGPAGGGTTAASIIGSPVGTFGMPSCCSGAAAGVQSAASLPAVADPLFGSKHGGAKVAKSTVPQTASRRLSDCHKHHSHNTRQASSTNDLRNLL